jgi:hypothetical protein
VASEIKDRRLQHRCTKDVGMHCALLHGDANRLVIVRNYSARGIYFESQGQIQAGTMIVIRTLGANDFLDNEATANAPLFSIATSDPDACSLFRSHVLAKVQRCVRLEGHNDAVRYGMGAEIQMLTDY